MNRRSFLGRILAAAVAAPAMDRIMAASVPKPKVVMTPDGPREDLADLLTINQPTMITWEWTPLPYPKTDGVLDPDESGDFGA